MKTPPRPVLRRAARVLLLDPEGRILLLRGGDPSAPEAGTWWITPGGGVEQGEDDRGAAVREVAEETGYAVHDLQGPVLHRAEVFPFDGRLIDQREVYFVGHVPAFLPVPDGWDELERRALLEARWWKVAELRTTDDTVYPEGLADLVDSVLGAGPDDLARPGVPPDVVRSAGREHHSGPEGRPGS